MSEPIRHHYVPQGYLKFFAKHEQRKNRPIYWVSVYDKQNHKQYCKNISEIAAEKHYNRITQTPLVQIPPEDDPLYYEKKYTDIIEGGLPQIIRNLMGVCTLSTNGAKVLTPSLKHALANLLVIQSLRTPNVRNYLWEIGQEPYDKIMATARKLAMQIPNEKHRLDSLSQLDNLQYDKEFIKSEHLYLTTDVSRVSRYANILIEDHVWIVYANRTQQTYITSDNPVIFSSTEDNQTGFGINGITHIKTIISTPLTPRHLVAVYHKGNICGQFLEKFRDCCILLNENEQDFIEKANRLQLRNCWRQIYTHPDAGFMDIYKNQF